MSVLFGTRLTEAVTDPYKKKILLKIISKNMEGEELFIYPLLTLSASATWF